MKHVHTFESFLQESKINESIDSKMAKKIDTIMSDAGKNPNAAAQKYFGDNKEHGKLDVLYGTVKNIKAGMTPDKAFFDSVENENFYGDSPDKIKDRQHVIDVIKKELGIDVKYKLSESHYAFLGGNSDNEQVRSNIRK